MVQWRRVGHVAENLLIDATIGQAAVHDFQTGNVKKGLENLAIQLAVTVGIMLITAAITVATGGAGTAGAVAADVAVEGLVEGAAEGAAEGATVSAGGQLGSRGAGDAAETASEKLRPSEIDRIAARIDAHADAFTAARENVDFSTDEAEQSYASLVRNNPAIHNAGLENPSMGDIFRMTLRDTEESVNDTDDTWNTVIARRHLNRVEAGFSHLDPRALDAAARDTTLYNIEQLQAADRAFRSEFAGFRDFPAARPAGSGGASGIGSGGGIGIGRGIGSGGGIAAGGAGVGIKIAAGAGIGRR